MEDLLVANVHTQHIKLKCHARTASNGGYKLLSLLNTYARLTISPVITGFLNLPIKPNHRIAQTKTGRDPKNPTQSQNPTFRMDGLTHSLVLFTTFGNPNAKVSYFITNM